MNYFEYIQFVGHEDLEPINCKAIDHGNNLVTIIFNNNRPDNNEIITSGYKLLNPIEDFKDISEDLYTGYTTLYKDIDENTIILSNDGSTYTEISSSESPTESYKPTIDETKKTKISSLSSICNKSIVQGVDVEIDGKIEHFSYNDEDQVNIKELFDLAVQTNVPLYYHADGESCKLYTIDQIVSIYTTNAVNKMHHITYFNQLKMYIDSLETIDEIEIINYGDELTGEYLNTYNEAMLQANVGLTTLLSLGGE